MPLRGNILRPPCLSAGRSFAFLYLAPLRDHQRELFVSGEVEPLRDSDVFVRHGAAEGAALTDDAVVEHDAAAQRAARADADAGEHDALVHLALDAAAVRHKGGVHTRAVAVIGADVAAGTGGDAAVRREELGAVSAQSMSMFAS